MRKFAAKEHTGVLFSVLYVFGIGMVYLLHFVVGIYRFDFFITKISWIKFLQTLNLLWKGQWAFAFSMLKITAAWKKYGSTVATYVIKLQSLQIEDYHQLTPLTELQHSTVLFMVFFFPEHEAKENIYDLNWTLSNFSRVHLHWKIFVVKLQYLLEWKHNSSQAER